MGIPKELEAWRQRVCWLRRQQDLTKKGSAGSSSPNKAPLPDLSDEALVASAGTWLKPYLSGVRTKQDFARLDWQVGTGEMTKARLSRLHWQVGSWGLSRLDWQVGK